MTAPITPEADEAVGDIADRHGLSRESVLAMLYAVNLGGGTMAQFAIPELGGSGLWMRGGMTMVGNMFDNALKARVDALCSELAQLLAATPVFLPSSSDSRVGFASAGWWPGELGVPSVSGGQNDARYAIFPGARRLVVQINGVTRIFDTGEHRIGGIQQRQDSRFGAVSFTSQFGTFDVSSLLELNVREAADTGAGAPGPRRQPDAGPRSAPQASESGSGEDAATIIATIESLARLHERGILSDEEFATKKTELLGRL